MTKKKPKPNLKEIKKHAQLFGNLSEVNKIPSGHQQLNPYLDYLKREEGISEEESLAQRNLLLHDTSQIGGYVTGYLVKHQDKLIEEVSKNPRTVLSKLEEQALTQMAIPHIGDDDYKTKIEILQSGESSYIGNAVMGLYESESWQRVVSNASSTALKDTLEKELTRDRTKHMVNDLGLDPKTGKINKKKTAEYLAPKITTNEDKLQIGLTYANQK